jgi:hypothetical protein
LKAAETKLDVFYARSCLDFYIAQMFLASHICWLPIKLNAKLALRETAVAGLSAGNLRRKSINSHSCLFNALATKQRNYMTLFKD